MSRILPSRPPIQKPAKAKRNPEHMARVAQIPCCICEAYGMAQLSPTQVHHVIHDRPAPSGHRIRLQSPCARDITKAC